MSNSKAITFATLMKNKQTASDIRSAFNSPAGSAKRKKAQMLFKTVAQAATNRYDGQGGPGPLTPVATPAAAPVQSTTYPSSSNVILLHDPTIKDLASQAGKTVVSSVAGGLKSFWDWYAPNLVAGTKELAGDVGKGLSWAANTVATDVSKYGTTSPFTGQQSLVYPLLRGAVSKAVNTPISQLTGSKPAVAPAGTVTPQNELQATITKLINQGASPEQARAAAPKIIQKAATDKAAAAANNGATTGSTGAPSTTDSSYQPSVGEQLQFGTQTDGTTTDTSGAKNAYGLTAEQESLMAGANGPEALMNTLLSDKKKLAAMMGVDAKTLPDNITPFLSENLADLQDTLKKKYGIENVENQLTSRINAGLNIKNELQDYVRGKDEYLDAINQQITKAKTFMQGRDLSNPDIAAGATNYMNYLYTLQGRQQQRYGNIVQSSVDYYTNQNTALQNNYNQLYKNFTDEYNSKAAQTTEWYDKVGKIVNEMYTNYANRDANAAAALDLQVKNKKNLAEMAGTALNAYGDGTSHYLADQSSYIKAFDSAPKKVLTFGTNASDVVSIPDVNISNLMASVGSQYSSGSSDRLLDPADVITHMNYVIGDTLPKVASVTGSSNNFNEATNIYTNEIRDYWTQNVTGLTPGTPEYEALKANTSSMYSTLINQIYGTVASEIASNPETQKTIINAIKDLISPTGHWYTGGSKPATYQQIADKIPTWKKTWTNSGTPINPSVLNAIEQYVKGTLNPNDAASAEEIFTMYRDANNEMVSKGSLDNLNANDLTRIIVNGYSFPFLQVGITK